MSKHYPNIIFWLVVSLIISCSMILVLSKKNELLLEDYYQMEDKKVEAQNQLNLYKWLNTTERRFPV